MEFNTHEIAQSKANDEDLSSNAKNLPLRHASFEVPERSLWINFLDNELKLTEGDRPNEGHNVSHIINTRQRNKMIVN